MIHISLILLTAIWRRCDGSSKRFKGSNIVGIILPLTLGYVLGFEGVEYIYPIAISVAMLDGFIDWNRYDLMVLHYSGTIAIGLHFAGILNWQIVLLAIIAGLFRPTLARIKMPTYGWVLDSSTAYAELLAPLFLMGGMLLV